MKKFIEFSNVTFNYESLTILEKINLIINEGDFIGIIGPNGSGKTTFLKLLLKELVPTSGEVKYYDDYEIGYVEQLSLNIESAFPYSVKEILMMGLYSKIGIFRFPKKSHHELIDKTLNLIGIRELKSKRISELSGGQQQKVMIAKALVASPSLLVLDEAFSGLDEESEKNLINLLQKLNKDHKMTILFVSHHFDDKSYLNRIFTLSDRNIIEIKKEKA